MSEPVLHYRQRKTKNRPEGGPKCGAFEGRPPPGHKVCKTWPELGEGGAYKPNACPDCIKARNAPVDEAPKADEPRPLDIDEIKADWSNVAYGLLQTKLHANSREPLLEKAEPALSKTVHSFVDVLDHYKLLGTTSHPLAALAINGYILFRVVKSLGTIDDPAALNRAYGLKPPDPAPAQPDPERQAAANG